MADSRDLLSVDDPFSGEIACQLPYADGAATAGVLERAVAAQRKFKTSSVGERVALVNAFCEAAKARKESIARDITRTMGKPIREARGEVDTMIDRARHMASIAEETLADQPLPDKPGFSRSIVREPLGVVVDIAPWNYPLLTAVNVVAPAVLAGNAVIIKPASRTPLCGDHFVQAFTDAGAPAGLVSSLLARHETVATLLDRPEVAYVAFTGSVEGGRRIYVQAAKRLIGAGLELGGKDPAYVAPDANLEHAIANLVDGAFYNAGQSCCGIERIYVHETLYDRFVEGAAALARTYRLGDPMSDETTLGPMATPEAPAFLAGQIEQAKGLGARILCGGSAVAVGGKGRFFEPTIVAEATHQMSLMVEESFGPIVGIASVRDDDEALEKMNDSPYGLTAAIWTSSPERARSVGRRLEAGTVFMNRCDYLDPALPWSGVKESGLGCSLSALGLLALTRPKSMHLRLQV